MNFRKFIISSLIVISYSVISAQGFKAGIIMGINMAQIEGDLLFGYNKIGLSAGGRVGYGLKDNMELSVEFLFSQRGAKERLFNSSEFNPDIRLTYLELPLVFSLKDWLIEKGNYHKVRADIGVSTGYLFHSNANFDQFVEILPDLKRIDFSYLAAVGMNFTKNIGVSIRYTRSLTPIFGPTVWGTERMLSYFLTFRIEYNF